jgi:uncharacterized protein
MSGARLTETVSLFGGLLATLLVLFIPITIGLVLAQRWLGTERLARLLGGERLLPALVKGTVLGAVTPFCGCSTVPLLLGLLRARVRFAGVAAFMLASPLLNPYILGVVALLFGARTAAVYAALAVVTSMGLGALWEASGLRGYLRSGVVPPVMAEVERSGSMAAEAAAVQAVTAGHTGREAGLGPPQPDGAVACRAAGDGVDCTTPDRPAEVDEPAWRGLRIELRAAWSAAGDLLRPMLRPLLLGVTIGALTYGVVPEGWLGDLLGRTTWWSLPLAAALGLPLYLRGEAAFPIGAGLLAAGVGEGPMFAMVIAGMGASLPEVTMLAGIFERRLLGAFLASVFATAILGGLLIPLG